MGIDLTRFDFHVVRFMYSEDVRAMSAAEVGQYILLLCEAWLAGKDTSLPDDRPYLASLAKCSSVSERVLAKFPPVDTKWGQRRRNSALYDEWIATLARSENGKKAVESRWNRDTGVSDPVIRPRNTTSDTQSYQPNHTNQSTQSIKNTGASKFGNMATRWRRAFGIALSGSRTEKDRYMEVCKKFGEDVVLQKFDSWECDNQWVREKRFTSAKSFYDALESMVEGDRLAEESREPIPATIEDLPEEQQKILGVNIARAEIEAYRRVEQANASAAVLTRMTPAAMFEGKE